MLNKNLVISLITFCFFLIIISFVKNETRALEKKIIKYEKKINILKQNLYESQLDYFYLSSPEVISKKIENLSDENYINTRFSQIYFSLNHFLKEQKNLSRKQINEKKEK